MKHLNSVVASLGVALLSSAAFTVQAASNPFAAQELSSGYSVAAGEKSAEGSCGEGKCGGEMKKAEGEDKHAEGRCGGEAKSAPKAAAEGKCGEGKCGADKTE
ncbi:MAG: hypothetical protein VCA57_05620 [Pseudomonas sp.]|uniref:HvfA family oxazolone/thioamide-modified RiPP metallophore n=1 Tax=Pseudomonas sp. TaxID=306 RepID=UPI0039820781